VIAGQYYLPKGETPEVLGYWVPEESSKRVTGNDCIAIPKSAQKPVLAHMFLNDLLDNDISLRNFGWNGYQPPLNKLSADYLVDQGYIPDNLMNAVVVPDDFKTGLTFYEVAPATEAIWRQSWSKFKAGG
jgi:spermidine/putrescine transport system substrate-binding protein